MTDLAELRMHLRDEHMRTSAVKARLSRKITSHAKPDGSTPSGSTTQPNSNDAAHDITTDGDGEGSFRSIINRLVENATEDDHDDGVRLCDRKIKISNLFDLQNTYWKGLTEAQAFRGLREELELHELVNLDAEGEADPGDAVDGMMEAAL